MLLGDEKQQFMIDTVYFAVGSLLATIILIGPKVIHFR